MLALALGRACSRRAIPFRVLNRTSLDIADPEAVERVLNTYQPRAILNAAGYSAVSAAACAPTRCLRDNAEGPETLAVACAARGIRLAVVSSALVFNGEKYPGAYVESDPLSPNRAKLIRRTARYAGLNADHVLAIPSDARTRGVALSTSGVRRLRYHRSIAL